MRDAPKPKRPTPESLRERRRAERREVLAEFASFVDRLKAEVEAKRAEKEDAPDA